MNDALVVSEDAIHLRRRVTEAMDTARERECRSVDLSAVEFVSRSAADEFIHLSNEYDIELEGLNGDVASMIEAVSGQAAVSAH